VYDRILFGKALCNFGFFVKFSVPGAVTVSDINSIFVEFKGGSYGAKHTLAIFAITGSFSGAEDAYPCRVWRISNPR